MFHDSMIWIAEALFYLMDGTLILNSPWIFVWTICGSILLLTPFYFSISAANGQLRLRFLPALVFLITFFPILMVLLVPPITQTQMVQECENVTVEVSTDRIQSYDLNMRQCRDKANYYGEWSEWKLLSNPY